jgi:hypothetical protein
MKLLPHYYLFSNQMNVLSLRKCTIHSAWEMAGIKMKEKTCKKSLKINPTPALSRCKFYFLHRDRCVCAYVCKSGFFQYFDQNEWTQSRPFYSKVTHRHTIAIQEKIRYKAIFISYFVTGAPIRLPVTLFHS